MAILFKNLNTEGIRQKGEIGTYRTKKMPHKSK